MESSVSTPHCSFIVYFDKDSKPDLFISDLRSFFQKFPLHYELVAVFEPQAHEKLLEFKAALGVANEKEKIKLVENKSRLGRAASLYTGLSNAEAEYMLTLDASLATPFGDQFKILQNLMTTPEVDICSGERVSKKQSPFHAAATPRHKLEHLFNPIFKEKMQNSLQDPLCESLGIRKKVFQEIKEDLSEKSLKGWYLNLPLLKAAKKLNMKIIEVPVHDSGAATNFHLWRERFYLLAKSIF
ncbi:glycosyltransferase [Bdellovibrio reynosensis]|uniref:Glycosyltransferase n=1 Tax=Bdellovibrio reynosensis TaxID=2835041 RepID=A0ABY4CCN8_9BACT|nr:glycosyltransferase [Bdellovibrio reynosensis]UOF02737.1 glycosyltransferase [Bdellovibrio reynosensis]